jgi:hypothetical protein
MFKPIEKDQPSIFNWTMRIVFFVLTGLIDIGVLYAAFIPTTTREERFNSFALFEFLLMVSLVFSVPVFPYVVWKLVKHERPVFWGIALIVAGFPVLLMLGAIITGR